MAEPAGPVAPFDPAAHPPLADLDRRLRELAGDAAYRTGRDYLRTGAVREAAVAGTSAYATVTGSTTYRVTVAFPSVEATKVTCTCPAHRRRAYCKHVVALCAALLEQPAAFAVLAEAPAPPPSARASRAPRRRTGDVAAAPQPAEQRAAGLAVLDRLLLELADGGLAQLGPEKAALIEQAAELVRSLKLRRLGNLLMQLQRAVADPRSLDDAAFAGLLLDLWLCRAATAAHLEGRGALDPRLAEDLVGKTWRASELAPVTGLELVELAFTRENDGEFTVETSYLVDLPTQEIYAERQITPVRLRSAPKPRHRLRLIVEEAGLYPGLPPRRLRLGQVQRAPLRAEDVERLIQGAETDLAELQRRLVERAAVPLGRPEVAVLFRPAALLAQGGGRGAAGAPAGVLDRAGRYLAVEWGGSWANRLSQALPEDGPVALFGFVTLGADALVLRCLAVVGAAPPLRPGPILPE